MTNPTVTCGHCKASFEGLSDTQANGCAADVHGQKIFGHYGSAVADMTAFRFTALRPRELQDGCQACDACLRAWLEEGLIEEVGELTVEGEPACAAELLELAGPAAD